MNVLVLVRCFWYFQIDWSILIRLCVWWNQDNVSCDLYRVYWCISNYCRFYLFTKYVIMCFTKYSRTLAHVNKTRFLGQDVFNGFECTLPNIRIFSHRIIIKLLGHWFERHQILQRSKTIIVVDIWLNSLSFDKLPEVNLYFNKKITYRKIT